MRLGFYITIKGIQEINEGRRNKLITKSGFYGIIIALRYFIQLLSVAFVYDWIHITLLDNNIVFVYNLNNK